MKKLSRRRLLQIGGATGAGVIALPIVDQVIGARAQAIDPRALREHPAAEQLRFGACDMCGAQDPLLLQVHDGQVVATFGNKRSRYSGGGAICGKAHAALEKANHPERITKPLMRRAPGRFESVSWDEAIDFMTKRLALIADKYGENAVHTYMGLGSQAGAWKSFWKNTFGTKNVFGNDSVCDSGRRTGAALTMGDSRPLPDLSNTKVGLVFGADYLSSTKYLWYVTGMLEALDKGARFYVVDPRFSETAARAVEYGGKWVPIEPGTDAALAAGIAHVIFANPDKYERHVDPHLVRFGGGRWSDGKLGYGVAPYAAYVADKTPEWAAKITGIDAAMIREIADSLVTSDAPLVDAWTGVSHRRNGVYSVRAALCLAGLVGAIDRPGGLVRRNNFKKGSVSCQPIPGATYRTVGHPAKLATACGMYGFVRSDVNSMVPQAILDPGYAKAEYERRRGVKPSPEHDYPVKAFITTTRNFANGNSGSALWRKALNHLLDDPEGLVVDFNLFVSEQGAHAHLVLPEAAYFERDDLISPDSLWPTCHVRRAVVPPRGQSKPFHEIVKLLAGGLKKHGFKGGNFSVDQVVPHDNYLAWVKIMAGDAWPTLEKEGVYEVPSSPRYAGPDGPREFGAHKLGKFTKTFDFYSPALAGEGIDTVPEAKRSPKAPQNFDMPEKGQGFDGRPVYKPTPYVKETQLFPIKMITCGRNQWNSASKTVHLASSTEKELENLMTMHPSDAQKLGVHDGARVKVIGKAGGEVVVPILVSEGIRPGVVHIGNGYGQNNSLEKRAARRGTNVNELTDPLNVDPIAGAEGIAEMLVRIEVPK